MLTYEYNLVTSIDVLEKQSEIINKLGKEGWELINFQVVEGYDQPYHQFFYVFRKENVDLTISRDGKKL